MQLSRLLLGHLAETVCHDPATVDARLATAIADAHRRWPGVVVEPARFVAAVAIRIPTSPPSLEQALDGLRLADLYLACACAAGDPKALAAFELAFLAGDSRTSDDTKQELRQKLFVGPNPRIAQYAGRGDLARWVRAAAARIAIDLARAVREVPTEDALLTAIGIDPGHGPALSHLKEDARRTLQAALREAIETLSDRERSLLLQYYIDGVGVVELGKLFSLAPSNVSRSLGKARVVLLAGIRRSLMRHKKIHGDELDSLVGLVGSQLSLTGGLRQR
ncbi:MAG: putative DNA-binding regulatory protein [Deltaproteobacteria bacterium]|nr:putative DNA-binding regulatory protein [Deltaproteobacteria bacterium]